MRPFSLSSAISRIGFLPSSQGMDCRKSAGTTKRFSSFRLPSSPRYVGAVSSFSLFMATSGISLESVPHLGLNPSITHNYLCFEGRKASLQIAENRPSFAAMAKFGSNWNLEPPDFAPSHISGKCGTAASAGHCAEMVERLLARGKS